MQKRQWWKIYGLLSCLSVALATAESLHIDTQNGRITFEIEIAQDLRKGLMNRDTLRPQHGMLFVYGRPGIARMWMKNTLIPLDMIFIQEDGVIESIHAEAQPHSLDTIQSTSQVKAVLEINGGEAKKLGIQSGDSVVHPVFARQKNCP